MLARRSLSLFRAVPRVAAQRSLSTAAPVAKPAGGRVAESAVFKAISTNNVHVLDSATLNTWQEIPRGGFHGTNRTKAIWSIWYNHAIVPLYAVSIIAAGLSTWFIYRYFSRHTEIAWSKDMRAQYDHQGADPKRADAHSNRLLYPGILSRMQRPVQIFPFNFRPTREIIERHKVDYAPDTE